MNDKIENRSASVGGDGVVPGKPTASPTNAGTDLVRALGPVDATMIVMGSMIGSGIFIV
jgi:hypothetical protein